MATNICKDFMYNTCDRGEKCRFVHDPALCFHWWKHGTCKFGDKCRKNHFVQGSDMSKVVVKKGRNTECWEPRTEPVDMRVLLDNGTWVDHMSCQVSSRDVVMVPNLFADFEPGELYNRLVDEVATSGVHPDRLFKMWHGNDKIEGTHLIADDKTHWKDACPTFQMIIGRIREFFGMRIEATRFNWYKDTSQWKPFHHDASGVNPEKAAIQNFTVALSLGATREAAFEHAATKTTISLPQPDGTIYCFAKDTNIIWRHGILKEKETRDVGRISVICWGWIDGLKDS